MKKSFGLILSVALLGIYGFGCDEKDNSLTQECDPTAYIPVCGGEDNNLQTICLNGMEAFTQCANGCDVGTGKCRTSVIPSTTCLQTGCSGANLHCNQSTGRCEPNTCVQTGCTGGQVCNTGTGLCENTTQNCVQTGCPSNQTCNTTSGLCEARQTCEQTGCNTGYRCNTQSGLCEATCIITGCESGYTCDEISGDCEADENPSCEETGCEWGYTCNKVSGECDATCVITECPDHYTCDVISGNCEPDELCSITGCDKGYKCNEETEKCEINPDSCVNTECSSPLICDESTETCVPKPVTTCKETGCEDGEWCNASTGLCVTKACGTNEKECRTGNYKAVCSETYTWTVTACGADEKCVSGDCVAKTCVDTGCDTGYTCNTTLGECEKDTCVKTGCDTGYTCNTTSGECEKDTCVKTGCDTGYTCNTTSGECEENTTPDLPIVLANKGIRKDCPDPKKSCTSTNSYTITGRVTAVAKTGFFMQTPDTSEPYNGMFIYTNAANSAELHDDVQVVGTGATYYGSYQLSSPTVTKVSSGNTPVKPVTISGTDIDAYHGMLVGFKDITVSGIAYGTRSNDGSDVTTDKLFTFGKVGTTDIYLGKYSRFDYKMPDQEVGTQFSVANGIVIFEYNKYRVVPRADSDFAVSGVPVVLSSVAADPEVAKAGDTVTITVTMTANVPESTNLTLTCTGGAACAKSVSVAAGKSSATFTFPMPKSDVTVTVTDGKTTKEVSITYDDGTTGGSKTETFTGTHSDRVKTDGSACAGTTSYCNGKFTSSATSLVWNYTGARTDQKLDGDAITFNGKGTIKTTITTGIKSVSVDAKQAYGGDASDRKIKISVKGTKCAEEKLTSSSEVKTITCSSLSATGSVELLIESTGSKQVTIDNVVWTY